MYHPCREFPATATGRSRRSTTRPATGSNARRRSLQVAGQHGRGIQRNRIHIKGTRRKLEPYGRALAGTEEGINRDKKATAQAPARVRSWNAGGRQPREITVMHSRCAKTGEWAPQNPAKNYAGRLLGLTKKFRLELASLLRGF